MKSKDVEKSVNDWLNQGYAVNTQRLYRWGLKLFLEYLNETTGKHWTVSKLVKKRLKDVTERHFWFEQQIVNYFKWLETYVTQPVEIPYKRRNARSGKIYTVIFHGKGGKTLSDSSRHSLTNAVRSFFAFHRLDLKLITQQKRLLGKRARLVNRDHQFTLNDFEKMVKVATPQERYILLAGKDLGLRASDFISLPQSLFAKALDKEPPVFLGKIWTQKGGIYAYPILTIDGLEAARTWLQVLKSKERYADKLPMLSIAEKELTENLRRLAKKANIATHGDRIRFHCLRKFLIDRLSLKMSESKWKQIVGKQISEGAYVSPLELREAYADVMDRIALSVSTQSDSERIRELEERADNYEHLLKLLIKDVEAAKAEGRFIPKYGKLEETEE